MYFARQGSAYQPSFMRQGSNEDVSETEKQVTLFVDTELVM